MVKLCIKTVSIQFDPQQDAHKKTREKSAEVSEETEKVPLWRDFGQVRPPVSPTNKLNEGFNIQWFSAKSATNIAMVLYPQLVG